jgi:gamma-glutamyltranspeptidase / glutathione hydrolase
MSSAACVASPHHLASEAGLEVLRGGGNALDAAVAINLVLGVVAPYSCGFGGDLFVMIWQDGLHAYNGSGRAPAAATPDAVRRASGADRMPSFGPLTVTVPGAVEAWFTLLERFGTKPFARLAESALRYAREGFTVSARAAPAFEGTRARHPDEREWQSIYGAVAEGQVLKQPQLARTIEALCDHGPDAYYRGEMANAIAEYVQGRGGLLERADLAEHRGDWVEPLSAPYRDVEVFELPPNTQGITALEALRIFDGLPAATGEEREHFMIESMKLALSDRDAHVTDPSYMPTPAEHLLSDGWIEGRRARIGPRAGSPKLGNAMSGGTAYMCAADAKGMLVSLIQSNWSGFGSGVTVPGWGINLHNRGALFSLDPHHVNAIAPRKRPMHTLIPGMAFRNDEPWLVFGSMGGHGQAQTHLQLLVRMIDDGMEGPDAIAAPRWVVSPEDWRVTMEAGFDQGIVDDLRARGHEIEMTGPLEPIMGHANAITVSPGGYIPATDPRAEGAALSL